MGRRLKCSIAKIYPIHYDHFRNMQNRSGGVACNGGGCGTEFTDDNQGFLEFVEYIGPVPSHLRRPTIGRKDHTKGYVRDNFSWQEHSENCSDAGIRAAQSPEIQSIRREASKHHTDEHERNRIAAVIESNKRRSLKL